MTINKFRYHLLALLVVAIWGVTFVCTKVLIGAGMAPAAIFFCRFVLAYAGIWVYTFIAGKERKVWNGWKDEGIFLLLGVSGGSMYFLTENTALVYTRECNFDQLCILESHLHAAFIDGLSWRAIDAGRSHRFGCHPFGHNLGRKKEQYPLNEGFPAS